jgi:phosphate transport system substrate-binding protein
LELFTNFTSENFRLFELIFGGNMKKTIITLVALLLVASTGAANAETVRIAGSGGLITMVTELAKAYMNKNPGVTIDVNQKSLGKEGGIMAINKGSIDIAMLASVEAKDKSLPLNLTEFAILPILFAVHPSVTAKALTSQQICDIYSGKITNWSKVGGGNAPITVLTRPENESAKIGARNGLACFKSLTEASSAISLAKSADMTSSLAKSPNAIGIINTVALSDLAGKVVAIKLDGKDVTTTPATQWPLKTVASFATSKTSNEAARKFISFVKSADGQAIIKREKAYPVQ